MHWCEHGLTWCLMKAFIAFLWKSIDPSFNALSDEHFPSLIFYEETAWDVVVEMILLISSANITFTKLSMVFLILPFKAHYFACFLALFDIVLFWCCLGLASATVPMYIAECTLSHNRGRLVTIFNSCVAGGQCVAGFIDGCFFTVDQGWR